MRNGKIVGIPSQASAFGLWRRALEGLPSVLRLIMYSVIKVPSTLVVHDVVWILSQDHRLFIVMHFINLSSVRMVFRVDDLTKIPDE